MSETPCYYWVHVVVTDSSPRRVRDFLQAFEKHRPSEFNTCLRNLAPPAKTQPSDHTTLAPKTFASRAHDATPTRVLLPPLPHLTALHSTSADLHTLITTQAAELHLLAQSAIIHCSLLCICAQLRARREARNSAKLLCSLRPSHGDPLHLVQMGRGHTPKESDRLTRVPIVRRCRRLLETSALLSGSSLRQLRPSCPELLGAL